MLRERGLRLTPQRQLILEAVHELGHATPEQVHTTVRERVAGVNITTVYRTLELLEELGLVNHTHLSHGSPTYHAAGEDQHVHLVCRELRLDQRGRPRGDAAGHRPAAASSAASGSTSATCPSSAVCGDCKEQHDDRRS